MLQLIPVHVGNDQRILADLAAEIWNEYWPAHIGQAQTDYMVENFQSLAAIRRDMAENGYEYWFLCDDEAEGSTGYWTEDGKRIVGYTGGRVEAATKRFFISKIYLLASQRGKHYTSPVMSFYEIKCMGTGLRAMYLTVNKYNEQAIAVYKAKGFEVIDSVETDIGEGFIMDDYIMEKKVY